MELWCTLCGSFIDQFERALYAYHEDDRAYEHFIDMETFVEYFLITELTKNPDGYRGSTYIHKDKRGPLRMGPVWDYNEAYGLCCGYPIEGYMNDGTSFGTSGGSAISTNGWRFNICEQPERCLVDPLDGISKWYRFMWKDPLFRSRAHQRWIELRKGPFSDQSVNDIISKARFQIEVAAWRNNARWSHILNFYDAYPTIEEITKIQTWTLKRMKWMDQALFHSPDNEHFSKEEKRLAFAPILSL